MILTVYERFRKIYLQNHYFHADEANKLCIQSVNLVVVNCIVLQHVKQMGHVVGELCGEDTWSRWRECKTTSGDGWLPHCCAWPWFNERQK